MWLLALSAGLVDGCAFWRAWPIVRLSPEIRQLFQWCLLMNGLLLGGSLLLYFGAFRPLSEILLGKDTLTVASIDIAFELLWCWPATVVALAFNTLWYQDIFAHIHRLLLQPSKHRANPSEASVSSKDGFSSLRFFGEFDRMKRMAAEEVVRVLMTLSCSFLAAGITWAFRQLLLFIFVPENVSAFVSWMLYFATLSALHSFHAFDYLWSNASSVGLMDKIDKLDSHFLYFVGFGASIGIILSLCSRFVAAALYAIIFPCIVLLTLFAKPRYKMQGPRVFYHMLSVVAIAVRVLAKVTTICHRKDDTILLWRRR